MKLRKEIDIVSVLEHADKLKRLWADPHPGLITWNLLVRDQCTAIAGSLVEGGDPRQGSTDLMPPPGGP
jgi:hypothetical protein